MQRDAMQFLAGDGRMALAIGEFDWASTPVGPIERWPAALKTAVGMMLNSGFPQAVVWGSELTTFYNDAFRPILGEKPEALGRSFSSVWSEVWEIIGPIAQRAYAGEATFIEDFPLVIDRHGHAEQAYFTFSYSPVRDESGRVLGMIDTVVETTTKVRAEREAQLLNRELAHRIQNTLTMVSALVEQTYRTARSMSELRATLMERLKAFGRAHSVLTQSSWSGAPIGSVLESALSPHRGPHDQISIEGPPVLVSAKQALSLALAIHELATNATKYGALSNENGRVLVRWDAGAPGSADLFRLSWSEHHGPAVAAPHRRGFGSRLIEEVLAQEFGGHVHLAFEPAGVRCELVTSMRKLGD